MNAIKLYFVSILLIALTSCKKEGGGSTPEPTHIVLEGGKGGNYSVAVFSVQNGAGKNARIYFKYAADKMPSDTSKFDEISNTMVEPGYGPHAHFNGIKTGTYYVYIKAENMTGEKVIQITDTSKLLMDIFVEVK